MPDQVGNALKVWLVGSGASADGSNPSAVNTTPWSSLAAAQVSVNSTATLIAAARDPRGAVTIVNHGTTDVFLGPSGVTAGTGVKLKGIDGAAITLPTKAAIYGAAASGTQTVSYVETY